MNTELLVNQVMTKQVVVGNLGNKFSQIMEFFCKHNIAHLPILANGELVGILSIKDVLNFTYDQLNRFGVCSKEDLDDSFLVEEVMTPDPITISSKAKIADALVSLAPGKFQALPVVDNGEIVGMITNKDLVKIYQLDAHPYQNKTGFTIDTSGFGI